VLKISVTRATTRLKRLPVISGEDFRKTRTNYFYKHLSICKMESQILALKKAIGISHTNWYFKYQLVLQISIGTSNTNWNYKYQLVLQIPIVTSNTNCYFKYQLVLQIPIGTSNTNWYFEYHE
jgi:hypothetical protein